MTKYRRVLGYRRLRSYFSKLQRKRGPYIVFYVNNTRVRDAIQEPGLAVSSASVRKKGSQQKKHLEQL